jgi:pilus assembly protein CpaE
MSNVVRLAIVDPSDASRASLKNLLLGIDTVWLEADCARYDFFFDIVNQTQPDIALVALDSDPNKALALVAKLTQEAPSCSVLVISSSNEGSLILQAMRNGAREFLNLPLKLEDALAALERIRQNAVTRSGDAPHKASQIIAVAGAGGGVGCTGLAVNLGCFFARNEKHSVALIDLDFALGDSDVWLDLIPDYTVQDVAENVNRLELSLLKRSMAKHECGLFLLPRPNQIDDKLVINPEIFKRIISLLKTTFTHLIFDVSKAYSPLDMAALELADTVLLIAQLDLPCLRNIVRLMQYFESRDELVAKTKVVVNRTGLEDTQISINSAKETIGRDIYWQIPNDFATMVEARNNGVPLMIQSPRAKITKSLEQLAQQLDGGPAAKPEPEDKKSIKGIFSFLGGASK